MNRKDLYKKAIEKWGVKAQVEMMIEECSELILALQKHKRNPDQEQFANIVDECADVTIMMEQAKEIFGGEAIDERIEFKISRLGKRLGIVPLDMSQKISDSILSVRVKNTCSSAGIVTVADLSREYNNNQLVKFRNFGMKSFSEVALFLEGKCYE